MTGAGHAGHAGHVVLLVGVGGLAADTALTSVATVTRSVSVVFVTAWVPPDALRERWTADGLDGEFLLADDLDAAVTATVDLHARRPVHGVVTYSELLLRPQAEITHRLGLPGNPPDVVAVAQSKHRQREVFAAAGVPGPRHAAIGGPADLAAAAAAVGFPAVLKPSLGAGSQGVRAVRDTEELAHAYDLLRAEETPFIQPDATALLEERLDLTGAPDSPFADYYSVESLLVDGVPRHVAICDRLRLRHGYVEEGLVLPTRLDDDAAARVVDCADRAVRAVGLRCGAAHTEVALLGERTAVIEVNARAGGPVVGMMRVAGGYDFAADIARVALGLPPDGGGAFGTVAWFRFLPVPEGQWRVARQQSVEHVRERVGELVQLRPRFRAGSVVSRAMTQHLASFLVRGTTPAAAMAAADAVERELGIELEALP